MAGRARIRFRWDVVTGRQMLAVEYDAPPDALPREHEREHRALVEKLRAMGVLQDAEGQELAVERVYAPAEAGAPAEAEATPVEPLKESG